MRNKLAIETQCTSFCKSDISLSDSLVAAAIVEDNVFKVWDLNSGSVVYTSEASSHGMYMALHIVQINDRTMVVCLCEDGYIRIIDIMENRCTYEKKHHTDAGK